MARKRLVLSVKDAASQLGLQPVTVRAHVARGNLKAQKLAGALWIDLEELQRFRRERRPPGHRALRGARWDAARSVAPVENAGANTGANDCVARGENVDPNLETVGAAYLAEAPECAPERNSF